MGLLVSLVAMIVACGGPEEGPGTPPGDAVTPAGSTASGTAAGTGNGATPAPGDESPDDHLAITLYFSSDEGRLRPEEREISSEGSVSERARRVVEALMEGPRRSLHPVMPAGVGLHSLYLGDDGTAYVDLDANFSRGLSSGSQDALLAVWALTDTLAVNFPEVRAVKILVEGEEVRELGGHLDLSRPLAPDMSLVEGPRR